MKTWKNKLVAILFLAIGCVCLMLDGDATFLVFAGLIGIPMIFAKENWIL